MTRSTVSRVSGITAWSSGYWATLVPKQLVHTPPPLGLTRSSLRRDWCHQVRVLPRRNIPPTQEVFVVVQPSSPTSQEAGLLRWGLIPSWADDRRIGNRLVHASAKTVATKPAFHRTSMRGCLDAYYHS